MIAAASKGTVGQIKSEPQLLLHASRVNGARASLRGAWHVWHDQILGCPDCACHPDVDESCQIDSRL